jgi:hypothetical protein
LTERGQDLLFRPFKGTIQGASGGVLVATTAQPRGDFSDIDMPFAAQP